MDSTDKLFDKIEALAAIKGAGAAKAKAEIIRTFTADERDIVRLALDPTITYGIAKLGMPTDHSPGHYPEWKDTELETLSKLATRQLTGKTALDDVNFTLRELSPKSAELFRRVILKDLRCNTGVTAFNAVFPGLITEFPYMRCALPKASKMDSWDWASGVYSQLKANGSFARAILSAGGVEIRTRQGNAYPDSASIRALYSACATSLQTNTETHGELTVWHVLTNAQLPRSEGNGMLNSMLDGNAIAPEYEVRFEVWDQIPLACAVAGGKCATPYKERLADLRRQVVGLGHGLITMIEHRVVYSLREAYIHYAEKLAQGLEGTVVKNPDGVWFDGDSKDQVKLKLEVDVDLKIVGFRPGEPGKRTEMTFGSVLCQTADGLLEVAVSGFKRDMEMYLHEHRDEVLGQVMCVRANEISKPTEDSPMYSLYHPRFVELRKDKVEADTLQDVIDQFAAAIDATMVAAEAA